MTPRYKRILLKLSGEALMGEDAFGINRQTIETIVAEVAEVAAMGVEIGVVIGGGDRKSTRLNSSHSSVSRMPSSA